MAGGIQDGTAVGAAAGTVAAAVGMAVVVVFTAAVAFTAAVDGMVAGAFTVVAVADMVVAAFIARALPRRSLGESGPAPSKPRPRGVAAAFRKPM